MKPKLARQWAEALRSGAYKQGRNFLHQLPPTGAEHCCLGVLCRLAIDDGVDVLVSTKRDNNYDWPFVAYNGNDGLPPNDVLQWAGFNPDPNVRVSVIVGLPYWYDEEMTITFVKPPDDGEEFRPAKLSLSFAGMNDGGFTFDQIADMIIYLWGHGDESQEVPSNTETE